MQRTMSACLVGVLSLGVIPAEASAEIQIAMNSGYARGTFQGAKPVALFGVPYGLGLSAVVGRRELALLASVDYQHFEFRSLSLGSVFQGGSDLFGGGLGLSLMGEHSQLQLLARFFPSNKLTVASTIVVSINGERITQQDSAVYSGGKAYQGIIRWVVSRGAGDFNRKPGVLWGFELAYLSQSFTNRSVSVLIYQEGGTNEVTDTSSFNYSVGAGSAGIFIGQAL